MTIRQDGCFSSPNGAERLLIICRFSTLNYQPAMIPLLFFLPTTIVFFLLAFFVTRAGVNGPWQREGPGRIVRALRRRNRVILIVAIAFIAVVAILEALLYDFHSLIMGLQYGAGDLLYATPIGTIQLPNGGVSWGLYLSILLGIFCGLILGTYLACRRYAILSSVEIRALA